MPSNITPNCQPQIGAGRTLCVGEGWTGSRHYKYIQQIIYSRLEVRAIFKCHNTFIKGLGQIFWRFVKGFCSPFWGPFFEHLTKENVRIRV